MIRAFTEADSEAVDRIYTACHPRWPSKPSRYWWAHPTLVLETSLDGVIGSTSCVVGIAPVAELIHLRPDAEVGWGHGVYVMPHQRGKGYGWDLAQARHALLKGLGVRIFFGMTQPHNAAMIAIFERQQLKKGPHFPNTYPDGLSGVLYSGEIV